MERILLIGLHPDFVDFERWPQLSPEKLFSAFEQIESTLRSQGHDSRICATDDGETAEHTVRADVADFNPTIIVIGAGVRADETHHLLFEKLINAAHQAAPNARFAFNTLPNNTLDAVNRWIS